MRHVRDASTGVEPPDVTDALDALEAEISSLQRVEFDVLGPAEELASIRRLEVLRRRLDHATDRAAGHLDQSCAFSLDGHRNARSALKHLGRLSGGEAHGRVQTARALRELPAVEAAYASGSIPTGHVRAIARVVANPRVSEFVPIADPIFAEQASTQPYDDFCSWLRQWQALADADGAAEAVEQTHERRTFSLLENQVDGTWTSRGIHGPLHGAVMKELLDAFEGAEFAADWAEARAKHGHDARVEHLARTPQQRRADALLEIFRRAGAAAADGRSPEPLVNIVIDLDTFERELHRGTGVAVEDDPTELDGRRCQTLGGTPLHPSDALAAALIGHVRRVVVDAASNVIDLGQRRRLFTGASRAAAELQSLLRGQAGLGCLWPGCDGHGKRIQIDHRHAAARGGPTDIDNSDAYCGSHNRIKEQRLPSGARPRRDVGHPPTRRRSADHARCLISTPGRFRRGRGVRSASGGAGFPLVERLERSGTGHEVAFAREEQAGEVGEGSHLAPRGPQDGGEDECGAQPPHREDDPEEHPDRQAGTGSIDDETDQGRDADAGGHDQPPSVAVAGAEADGVRRRGRGPPRDVGDARRRSSSAGSRRSTAVRCASWFLVSGIRGCCRYRKPSSRLEGQGEGG